MFGLVNESKLVYSTKIPLIQIYLILKSIIRGELKQFKNYYDKLILD